MNLISFELNNRPALAGGVTLPVMLQLGYTVRSNGSATPDDLRIKYALLPPNTRPHIMFDNTASEVTHTKILTGFSGNLDDRLTISSSAPFTAPYTIDIEITPRINNQAPGTPQLLVLTINGNTLPPQNTT